MYSVEIRITHVDDDGLIVPLVDTCFERGNAGSMAVRLEELAFQAEEVNAKTPTLEENVKVNVPITR